MGGAEVLVKDMAPRLASYGVECDVATLRRTGSQVETQAVSAGVVLHHTGVKELYSPRQILPLVGLLRSYDLVHVHLFPAQLWAILAAKIGRRRPLMIYTEHNTWTRRRDMPWLRRADAWLYEQYGHVICNSEATAASLQKWAPGLTVPTSVILNGIPLERFAQALPAEIAAPRQGATRLVAVARLDPQKDHATLFRALVSVPQAQLLLVGDGPLRRQLEQLAAELGIGERVFFLGWRSDVPEILKASDIFVHSTHSDGFGIAACEAMAAGLPVIASDVPGLSYVLGDSAVLVPQSDPTALADALRRVIADRALYEEMKRCGLQRAEQFSIDRTAQKHADLYHSLLKGTAV